MVPRRRELGRRLGSHAAASYLLLHKLLLLLLELLLASALARQFLSLPIDIDSKNCC